MEGSEAHTAILEQGEVDGEQIEQVEELGADDAKGVRSAPAGLQQVALEERHACG